LHNYFFTSESVTEGHPDKICDQVADAVLDAILAKDPYARVACEVAAATGLLIIMGEITTDCNVDVQGVARDTVRRIGYTDSRYGFDADSAALLVSLNNQSQDIALGVDRSVEAKFGETAGIGAGLGAGDQGMMFGYATNETDEHMPIPIYLAHKLAMRLAEVRKSGVLPYLRPDGKTQVTVEYRNGVPFRVDTIVISAQHSPNISVEDIRRDILTHVVKAVIPETFIDFDSKIIVNPTGRFVTGGPNGDTGLTGRKIIVDTYGGRGRHGGGAFSGKDPSKVDRSATYMLRYICKNVVAAGLAKQCEIEVAYAIGRAHPVSLLVNTYGTGKVSDEELAKIITKVFDLRPAAIIEQLKLLAPQYAQTARNGHFGNPAFNWEKTDKVKELKSFV